MTEREEGHAEATTLATRASPKVEEATSLSGLLD